MSLGAQKFSHLFKTRKQPKQGKRSSSVLSHNGRIDRFGAPIKRGGKHKVTFRDQVATDSLYQIHEVQSFKKYNVLTVKEQRTYCSCSIF
mmetsp:Transcript_7825/g.7396  ORF Transcript_7825/g.7396 Transcript_7825/m.7396 type:complete len:90 (+) Transcript_7825:121-390(+)